MNKEQGEQALEDVANIVGRLFLQDDECMTKLDKLTTEYIGYSVESVSDEDPKQDAWYQVHHGFVVRVLHKVADADWYSFG